MPELSFTFLCRCHWHQWSKAFLACHTQVMQLIAFFIRFFCIVAVRTTFACFWKPYVTTLCSWLFYSLIFWFLRIYEGKYSITILVNTYLLFWSYFFEVFVIGDIFRERQNKRNIFSIRTRSNNIFLIFMDILYIFFFVITKIIFIVKQEELYICI